VQYWHALRAHRLLIVGITLVALLVALIVVETATKRYDAAAHLGINPISNFDNGPVAADGALFQQPADGSSVTVRATEVLSSPRYLDAWKRSRSYRALGPNRDSATITLSPLSQADIIAVQASAPEAGLASAAANHFGHYVKVRRDLEFQAWLKERIQAFEATMQTVPKQSPQHATFAGNVAELQSALGTGDKTVSFIAPASAPGAPAWPRPKLTLAVALLVGLLLGIAAAVTLEVISPRFMREEDLTRAHRLPVLARVPRLPARAVQGYFLGQAPLPREAWKAYRTLRAVLSNAGGDGDRFPTSIAVTSAGPGDGKTLTAVNLAIALSSAGLNVTLVDADLPRPMVGTVFNIVGHRNGVVRLLNNPEAAQTGAVDAPLHSRLKLLLASEEQMHELHLFDTQRVRQLLDRLASESDVVVIDMPPLTEVAEAVAFADASETVVVCVRIGHTRRDKLAELRDLLARRGVVPLGFFVTSRRGTGRSDKVGYQGYPGELPLIPGDYLLSPEERQPSAENP
jgi:Mrp family chromosome partitioning ATPase/capsular polysaccharide biosynthesis protein